MLFVLRIKPGRIPNSCTAAECPETGLRGCTLFVSSWMVRVYLVQSFVFMRALGEAHNPFPSFYFSLLFIQFCFLCFLFFSSFLLQGCFRSFLCWDFKGSVVHFSHLHLTLSRRPAFCWFVLYFVLSLSTPFFFCLSPTISLGLTFDYGFAFCLSFFWFDRGTVGADGLHSNCNDLLMVMAWE